MGGFQLCVSNGQCAILSRKFLTAARSHHSLDLTFWYDSAFGAPLARTHGIGYVQELVARLTHTPIEVHNSTTNGTLNDNPVTFPLGQSLYVDATHEVVVLYGRVFQTLPSSIRLTIACIVITALNLTSFAAGGPLPADHIPSNRTFRSAELSPFATNIQFQRKLYFYLLTSCSPLFSFQYCRVHRYQTLRSELSLMMASCLLQALKDVPNNAMACVLSPHLRNLRNRSSERPTGHMGATEIGQCL